ncbi:MAG: HD-GYP domain-containing protein [Candidatus Brocadiaceae bacterium]|uniref:HD-GYP domain-containing protein n=1 Tax=Candidatus Wunengus sp. YC61 TaxID=3367698 RepID=UPI00272648BE|nr:HD-GYP domain-containing protein [Candidatus Brocadiaceae bacterium]
MARLSDLIKQGKVPEKNDKSIQDERDKIRIRELAELKTKKETVVEEKKDSARVEEAGFPSEAGIKKEEKKTAAGLGDLEFPSEPKTKVVENVPYKVSGKPSFPGEIESLPTEAGMIIREEERKEKVSVDIYDEFYEFLAEVLDAAKTDQKFSIDRGVELVTKVIDTPSAIESLYRKAIYRKEFKYDSNVHGINVAIFAIKIGEGLGYKRDQLVELGIAALIHDIGMCKIPDEVVNKEGVLTNEEYALIKKHPQFGYEIVLNSLGEKYKWLAEVVSQEQEREGGQGYPRGLLGNEIHEYAKVIGIVDVYEALSHPRPQRKRFLPYEATKVIVNSSKNMFPQKLIRALLTKLSCFPTGSYVVLNSKAIGRVVETNEAYPLRPVIEMLYDSMGKKLTEKKVVKLQDTPLLYITDSMFEEDLPK